MLTAKQAVKKSVPPALKDRYVARLTDKKFSTSSKGNPMVTLSFEVCGIPLDDGTTATSLKRGDVTYEIAGLKVEPVYFTLVEGPALDRFAEFYRIITGQEFEGIDETNPDLGFLEGNVVLECMLEDVTVTERKVLTPEERATGKKEGDPILGSDRKPITKSKIRFCYDNPFIARYTGQVNPF
jgi:hypothetical protein